MTNLRRSIERKLIARLKKINKKRAKLGLPQIELFRRPASEASAPLESAESPAST